MPINLNLDTGLTCRLVAGLTREQRDVCHNAPDTAAVAFEGLQMAVRECQHQFRWNRWNCSSLSVKSANPHASAIMKRGQCVLLEKYSYIYFIPSYLFIDFCRLPVMYLLKRYGVLILNSKGTGGTRTWDLSTFYPRVTGKVAVRLRAW